MRVGNKKLIDQAEFLNPQPVIVVFKFKNAFFFFSFHSLHLFSGRFPMLLLRENSS
jgi:hypothetical protein